MLDIFLCYNNIVKFPLYKLHIVRQRDSYRRVDFREKVTLILNSIRLMFRIESVDLRKERFNRYFNVLLKLESNFKKDDFNEKEIDIMVSMCDKLITKKEQLKKFLDKSDEKLIQSIFKKSSNRDVVQECYNKLDSTFSNMETYASAMGISDDELRDHYASTSRY